METMELKTQEITSDALGWLVEMEQVNNPHFLNALVLNILKISNNVKDVQFIVDSVEKRMLVWLDASFWFFRKRRKQFLEDSVLEMLQTTLPSYDFRIIYDKELFNKARELANDGKN